LRPVKILKSNISVASRRKLYEELLTAEEGLTKTVYEKIFVGQPGHLEHSVLTNSLQKVIRQHH